MGDMPCVGRHFIQSEYNKWANYDNLKNTNYERTINRRKGKSL